ncbi:MAG: ATP-binding protein [Actinomycetes bacterium]
MTKQRPATGAPEAATRQAATGRSPGTHPLGEAALTLVQPCSDVVVLRAAGNWSQVTSTLALEAEVALGEAPRAVVVDLSAAQGPVTEADLDRLIALGERVRDWPGTSFAVTSPDARVRSLLRSHPMSLFVHVAPGVDRAVTAVAADDVVQRVSLRLEPQARAAREARHLVSRTCLDWRLAAAIPPACLIVNELVTNAVVHAGTSLEVTLARIDSWLRLAVRDGSATPPSPQPSSDYRRAGRGLLIVDRLAYAWGHVPSADGGKILWAVLAVHTP